MSGGPGVPSDPEAPLDHATARRAVGGVGFTMGGSVITAVLGVIRALLLARLLMPEHFGAMALALALVQTVERAADLGLDQAVNHRPRPTGAFLATCFALRVGMETTALALLLAALPLLAPFYRDTPQLPMVILAIVPSCLLTSLAFFQQNLVRKEMQFRELVAVDVACSVAMTVLAPLAAWLGWGVWALAVEQYASSVVRFGAMWLPLRLWSPRLGWDPEDARWLLRYCRESWAAGMLGHLLERFDDLWVGTALGSRALGFYSRAWEFARFPRRAVGFPLGKVILPVFSLVQDRRGALGEALRRSLFLALRATLLGAAGLALALPEMVAFVIGPQWEPMILPFRCLVLYAVLDPVLLVFQQFLLAVGQPGILRQVRTVQAVFFVPAAMLGAWLGQVVGVALAADAMVLLGVLLLARPARDLAGVDLLRQLLVPLVAGALSVGAGLGMEGLFPEPGLQALAARLVAFGVVLAAALALLDRRDLGETVAWVRAVTRGGPGDVETLAKGS